MSGYILTFTVTHAVNFYLSLRLLMDASGCSPQPVFLLKTLLCVMLSGGCCLLLPGQESALRQIFCTCAVFLTLYPSLLTLTDALPPEERRWLRRTLLPPRATLTFRKKRRTMEKIRHVR